MGTDIGAMVLAGHPETDIEEFGEPPPTGAGEPAMTREAFLGLIKQAPILLVDDTPENAQRLDGILKADGYSAVTVTTDPDAAALLHERTPFDLIVLDVRPHGRWAFDVLAGLRERIRNDYLPVIVITAQTDLATRLRALELGAKDFLTKPFEAAEVLLRIANSLEVRLLCNQRQRKAEILEDAVRVRTRELRDSQFEIIRRLARAGEFRDNETGMHVLRIGYGCHLVALAAGLDSERAELIQFASPMHDVGKIGIPDRILRKPGRLDAAERAVMNGHTTIGAEILSGHAS